MAKQGECRLCHTTTQLCESHIIPSSMFKLIRDPAINNRFIELSCQSDQTIQDGPKEHLLCQKCEQKFCHYEKYFKEAIYLRRHGIQILQDRRLAIVKNLKYRDVKLFFLSLLYRMSISSLQDFEHVNLKEKEEGIRQMLENESPGKDIEYPVAAIIPLINGKRQEEWATTAFASNDGLSYAIVLGGILYLVFILLQNDNYLMKFRLLESGSWTIPIIDDFYKIPFLRDFIDSHLKNK